MQIAVATDAAYLPWTAAAVVSVLQTTIRTVTIHLLHAEDVTVPDLGRMTALVTANGGSLVPHLVREADLAALPSKGPAQGGRMSWARILLPERLADLTRVVYLDADVLALQPLDSLWDLDLGQHGVAAVANVVEPAMHPHVASLGLADPSGYFNAGVLVIDLHAWRVEGTRAAITDVATRRPDSPWYDQDALNVVFADRWLHLHPRWNAMNSLWTWRAWAEDVYGTADVEQATAAPAILHFEGPTLRKPWHYLSQHPWTREYLDTLDQTPWSGAAPIDRTPATIAIGRLPTDAQVPAFMKLLRWRARRDRSR